MAKRRLQREALSACSRVLVGIGLGLAACAGGTDEGAPHRRIELGTPDWVIPDEFTFVSSIRVLRSGDVIITDPREQRIVLATPQAVRTSPVGRQGRGPGEWLNAVRLEPLAGDSSIQLDPVARRWIVFDGAEIIGEIAQDRLARFSAAGMARQALGEASVISVKVAHEAAGAHDPADSGTVVRFDLRDGAGEAVARVRLASASFVRGPVGGAGTPIALSKSALAVDEEAIGFPDGWLAVIRVDPYRVDWRRPDGVLVLGEAAPRRRHRITEAERSAYLRRNEPAIKTVERMPSPMRETLRRRITELPEFLPEFVNGVSVAGGDSRLYVRRLTLLLAGAVEYDVFDRSGEAIGILQLGPDERLGATTEAAAFIVRSDRDGLERISRRPWRGVD